MNPRIPRKPPWKPRQLPIPLQFHHSPHPQDVLLKHIRCVLQNVAPKFCLRTVDGRNPVKSPIEVGSLCHYLQGFIHPKRGCLGFIPSTGSFRGLLCFLGVCVCFTYCPILFKVEKQNIEGVCFPPSRTSQEL